jgi:hypothetical protein
LQSSRKSLTLLAPEMNSTASSMVEQVTLNH